MHCSWQFFEVEVIKINYFRKQYIKGLKFETKNVLDIQHILMYNQSTSDSPLLLYSFRKIFECNKWFYVHVIRFRIANSSGYNARSLINIILYVLVSVTICQRILCVMITSTEYR